MAKAQGKARTAQSAPQGEPRTLRVEYMAIEDIRPYEKNPKGHDIPELLRSFERFGFVAPPGLNDARGELYGGHGRLEALALLRSRGAAPPSGVHVREGDGAWLVPVLRGVSFTSEAEHAAFLLADNRLAQKGGYDAALLEAVAAIAGTSEHGLVGTGFTQDDISAILALEPSASTSAAAESATPRPTRTKPTATLEGSLRAETISKPGDVWLLGRHRLAVGDATDPELRAALVGERKVDLVCMDPPYAIYGSSTGVGSDIADDSLVIPAFVDYLRTAAEPLKLYGHLYVFCDWRSSAAWWQAAKRVGLAVKNRLVWHKGTGGLGSAYQNTYEDIFFMARTPAKGRMKHGEFQGGERLVQRPNILEYPKVPPTARIHNAQKPDELIAELLRNSSDEGETVYDPFCGSGTTLVNCERLGRTCLTSELDPVTADAAIRRFVSECGGAATHEALGTAFPG